MSLKYSDLNGSSERTPLTDPANNSQLQSDNTQPVEHQFSQDILTNSTNVDHQIDNKQDENEEENTFSLSKVSRNQKLLLIFGTAENFLAGTSCSLLTSFFPIEAEKKGVCQTLVGFVFCIYPLIVFFVFPFFGNYLTKFGTRFLYCAGIFVGGVGAILFGTLNEGPDGTIYVVMSVLCRATEAIGYSANINACMAIVCNEFPENVRTVDAILEIGSTFGFMFGPVVGGALYELGGYGLPFYVIGSSVLVNGVIVYMLMPSSHYTTSEVAADYASTTRSIFHFIRSPSVMVPLMGVFVVVSGVFVLHSTFAKHVVDKFHLQTAVVGLLFVIGPTVYALTVPLVGYLSDVKDYRFQLTILGYVLFTSGFLLCGPSRLLLPFVPFDLTVITIGLLLIGLSTGCLYVPTMKTLSIAAHELGYSKSADTAFAMVPGLFNSVMAFGGFFGSFAGAAVVQIVGYSVGYTLMSFCSMMALLIYVGFYAIRYLYGSGVCIGCDSDSMHGTKRRKKGWGGSSSRRRYQSCNDREGEEDCLSTGSRGRSFSTSMVSGIPGLSLSWTYSERSASTSTSNRDNRTHRSGDVFAL